MVECSGGEFENLNFDLKKIEIEENLNLNLKNLKK